jgi:hypothetical protein
MGVIFLRDFEKKYGKDEWFLKIYVSGIGLYKGKNLELIKLLDRNF